MINTTEKLDIGGSPMNYDRNGPSEEDYTRAEEELMEDPWFSQQCAKGRQPTGILQAKIEDLANEIWQERMAEEARARSGVE